MQKKSVFYKKFLFCRRFVFYYRLLSLAFLSQPRCVCRLTSFLFLWSSWWVFRPCFLLGFPSHGLLGMSLQKWASTFNPLSIWVFIQLTCECLSSFLGGSSFWVFTFLRQIVFFLFANLRSSKGSQKVALHVGGGFVVAMQSEFAEGFASFFSLMVSADHLHVILQEAILGLPTLTSGGR